MGVRHTGLKGDEVFVKGGMLTDEGQRLLASCMVEVFWEKGDWDFRECAKRMREMGVQVSASYVRREWAGPGRVRIESLVRTMREEYLRELEDRLRYEILKAGVDVVRERGQGWSGDVKNITEAVRNLVGAPAQRQTQVIPQITFRKVEVIPPPNNAPKLQAIDIQAERAEGRSQMSDDRSQKEKGDGC